jgi:hypothetical protein
MKTINLEQATLLRKQGLSYSAIAKELNCSIDWCKRNLSSVQKNIKENDTMKALVAKAKSTRGITSGEILKKAAEITPINPDWTDKEKSQNEAKVMQRLRTKVKAVDNTIVRPYWMKPEEAHKSLQLVLQAVTLIDERVYEQVQDIIQELDLDETYIDSLTRAITQMSYGGNLLQHIQIKQLTESYTKTADELERRNKP